ncbi:MAG: hypothetical protein R2932_50590 [Caldilineaceae bacterium]
MRTNLYWNGERALPLNIRELVNITDDPQALVGDPELPTQADLIVRWVPQRGRFADGSATIHEAFVRLVRAYGTPASTGAAVGAADPAQAPWEDILGMPRRRDNRRLVRWNRSYWRNEF